MNSLSILESMLRNCNAEKYINNFTNNGVDTFCLKLLNEEDLKELGVENEETRKTLLKRIANLQIPSERIINREINKEYVILVLQQMYLQLNKHFANLSCALNRSEVFIMEVQLQGVMSCLQRSINSLDKEINRFRKEIVLKEPKKVSNKSKRNILIVLSSAFFFSFGLGLTKYILKLK